MPSNHQYAFNKKGWAKSDLRAKAQDIGTHTAQVAEHILSSSIYPEQNYKSCYGMLMLQKPSEAPGSKPPVLAHLEHQESITP
jgi:hypothetical protein